MDHVLLNINAKTQGHHKGRIYQEGVVQAANVKAMCLCRNSGEGIALLPAEAIHSSS